MFLTYREVHKDLKGFFGLLQKASCCVMSCVVYKVMHPEYKKAEILKALNTWNVSPKARKVTGTFKKLYPFMIWKRNNQKWKQKRSGVGGRFWPASRSDMQTNSPGKMIQWLRSCQHECGEYQRVAHQCHQSREPKNLVKGSSYQ